MPKFKNNHYLSQFYLKWFLAEDNPYNKYTYACYYLKKWIEEIKIWWIENIASENYLFNFIETDWTYNAELEKSFWPIEVEIRKVINYIQKSYKKVKKTNDISHFYKLTENDKEIMIIFFQLQLARSTRINPIFIEKTKNMLENEIKSGNFKKQLIDIYKRENPLMSENKIEALVDTYIKNRSNDEKKRWLHNSLNVGVKYAKDWTWNTDLNFLLNRNWYFRIITNDDKSFITSDFPFSVDSNREWASLDIDPHDTFFIFPVTNKIALLINWTWNRIIPEIDNRWDNIRNINCCLIADSSNIIISSNKKLLERVKKDIDKKSWKYYIEPIIKET